MDKKVIRVLAIEDDPNYFILLNERLSKTHSPGIELIRSKLMQTCIKQDQVHIPRP